jgi:phosphate starvation-inducible PhoH-like protein
VITGDVTQIDLPAGKKSGLIEALEVCGKIEGIGTIQFGEKDVVRHNLVQQIIRAYEEYDVAHPNYAQRNSGSHAAMNSGAKAGTNAANGKGERRVKEAAKDAASELGSDAGRGTGHGTGPDVK